MFVYSTLPVVIVNTRFVKQSLKRYHLHTSSHQHILKETFNCIKKYNINKWKLCYKIYK